jgi:hypothetical protein
MPADPEGLLQRIAELRPLCEDDARLRAAVESGDAFRVYRALVWARLFRRLPQHRETLDALVRRRRLFARPLKGSPYLGTFNSIGASFVGSDEAEPDGSYVTTYAVVVAFVVPLFPLGAYLVQSTGSRSWRIFARVPLGLVAFCWTRAVALAAIAAVVVGAAGAFHASRFHDVTVVNAFTQPLQVRAGETKVAVGPGARATLNLPVGKQALRAETAEGAELEVLTAEVAAGSRLQVWNVAGAAPVYRQSVIYTSGPSSPDAKEPEPTVFCGQRWVEQANVDYAFVEAPKSISMPKSQGTVTKARLDVAPVPPGDQVILCAEFLVNQRKAGEALPMLSVQARLDGWQGVATQKATSLAMMIDPARALELATHARDAAPDDLDAHRTYQQAARRAGREAEVRAEYQARAAAEPQSARAQYLALRLAHDPDSGAAAERLVSRFPSDPQALRLALPYRLDSSDWAGVVRAWEALSEREAHAASWALAYPVTALVAQGRPSEATALVERQFAQAEPGDRPSLALLYARVVSLQGRPEPDRLLKQLEKERPRPLLRLEAGLDDDGTERSPLATLLRQVAVDPAAARQAAAELAEADLFGLEQDAWALTYGEAVRVGDEKAATSLARLGHLVGEDRQRFERFVKGEAVRLDGLGLPLQIKAAAALVRSRNPSLSARERGQLLAQARRDDWLRTNVYRAVDGWTRAAAGR